MSINIKTTLRDLQRQIEGGRPKEAEKWVEILSGYFDDNTLTSAQIGRFATILPFLNDPNNNFLF